MSDDDDLKSLDPDDLDSVVAWSRARQFRSSSPAEPKPEEQNTQASAQQQWVDYIDERIRSFVAQYVEETVTIIAEEIAETYGRDIKKLRDDTAKRVQLLEERAIRAEQNAKKVTIIAPGISSGMPDISESIKKHCEFFFAGLANDVREIRHTLNLRREPTGAEVIDLPPLPKRRTFMSLVDGVRIRRAALNKSATAAFTRQQIEVLGAGLAMERQRARAERASEFIKLEQRIRALETALKKGEI